MMGSYNPIHLGHIQIAKSFFETNIFDEIWLVVSPQSPHKAIKELAKEEDRFNMCTLALSDISLPIYASSIEFNLPKPSYTIDTLNSLNKKNTYSLLLGSDNLDRLHEWKDIDKILATYKIYCYDRGNKLPDNIHPNIKILYLPILNISSTIIRKRIQEKKDISNFVSKNVLDYITAKKLYL